MLIFCLNKLHVQEIWLCGFHRHFKGKDGHLSSVVEVPELRLPAHQGVGVAH